MATDTERRIDTYINVWVVWNAVDTVDAFLCDEVTLTDGWVHMLVDCWLWHATEDFGANERDYFDEPQRMAVPACRVREVVWPKALASKEGTMIPHGGWHGRGRA